MKTTLITGASGGIGEVFARTLAAEKHNLFLVARSENKLKQLCDELSRKHNIKANYITADLTKPGSDELIYNQSVKLGLEINMLINNAGIGSLGDFTDLSLTSELNLMTLNMQALVALTHRFIPPMRQRNSGSIINVGSGAGFQPVPYMATYAASKAFVGSFSEAIAEENRPFNIKVVLMAPGITDTNFFSAASIRSHQMKFFGSSGKLDTPEEVVQTALEGLKKGKTVVVAKRNRTLSRMINFIPNSVLTKQIAKGYRATLKK